jgi:predicted permease
MELLNDVKHALRLAGRNKAWSGAVVATLALGLGANTAAFSFVHGVLLRPLPYANAERLVRVSEEHPGAVQAMRASWLSNVTYHAWSRAPRSVEGLAAYAGRLYTIDRGDEPERVSGAAVSPSLFRLLGARPAHGRFFLDAEAVENAPRVVVLGHGLWRERFGADPAVVGRGLRIEDREHTIVGIAEPGFAFPDRDARLWTPYVVRAAGSGADQPLSVFFAIGRLKPGAVPAQAEAEGTSVARGAGPRPQAADLLFGKGGPVTVKVRSLQDDVTASVRPALVVLTAAAFLVLLIACANVAHLFLSRGLSRRRELGMREALGAGRGRVVRELLAECLTLTALGGLAGLALAAAITRLAPALAPPDFPRIDQVTLDGPVVAFAALLSLLAGLAAGLPAALRSTRRSLIEGSLWASEGSFGGGARGAARGALLVTQSALAVLLLVGAGLLLKSFARLIQVDAGYDPRNVLVARVHVPGVDAAPERNQQAVEGLLERLRRQPDVLHAGAGNMAPFEDSSFVAGFELPPRETGGKPTRARALQHQITPGYAEALSLRLVEGRFFAPADVGASRRMLVNREFARQYLAPGPVVGLQLPNVSRGPELTEVVGVVADVLKDGLDAKPQPEVYLLAQPGRPFRRDASVVVRTAGDPLRLAASLRALLRQVDGTAAVDQVGTLAERVRGSVSQPRFATAALSSFALLALALSALGIYAVLSYAVTQRRRELGVRAALGATRQDLLRLVLKQGLAFTLAGLAFGMAGAAAFSRVMADLLFGVPPLDPFTFALAPLPLLLAATAACLVPARRAAAADPADVLRSE